ncbi:MAG TPA: isochorismatase family protein [Beijerinckiaceae bacterium]|nr:isochorismatase family protein [Beijerinckiaceae bacterium]
MGEWRKHIPASEFAIYDRTGFSARTAMGERTALIVVDTTLGFTGSEGLSFEQAVAEFRTAAGPVAWRTMPAIAQLVAHFRARGAPIVFTCSSDDDVRFTGNATKSNRRTAPPPRFNDFPAAIAPLESEWVLQKTKASAFFQTPLLQYLVQNRVDTLVLCGVSTSGCVRASAVDAFSNGFATFVAEDCCFDRSFFAHCANLFDMDAKYANVASLKEILALLDARPAARAAAE